MLTYANTHARFTSIAHARRAPQHVPQPRHRTRPHSRVPQHAQVIAGLEAPKTTAAAKQSPGAHVKRLHGGRAPAVSPTGLLSPGGLISSGGSYMMGGSNASTTAKGAVLTSLVWAKATGQPSSGAWLKMPTARTGGTVYRTVHTGCVTLRRGCGMHTRVTVICCIRYAAQCTTRRIVV